MSSLALLVDGLGAGWIFAFGLTLFLVDLFIVQTAALMTIGMAAFGLAALNLLDVPPLVQLWSIPAWLVLAYFLQRRIYALLGRAEVPFEEGSKRYVGQNGHLRLEGHVNTSEAYFYGWQARMPGGSVAPSTPQSDALIMKVELQGGEVRPAILEEGPAQDGMPVVVTGTSAYALVVRRRT